MQKHQLMLALFSIGILACQDNKVSSNKKGNRIDTLDFNVKILFGDTVKTMIVDSKEDYRFGYNSPYASFKDKCTGETVEITSGTPAIIIPFNPQKKCKP